MLSLATRYPLSLAVALLLAGTASAAPPSGPRVSFVNEVVPILTRLGCNSGGCHGKAEGQNGFKLSLFGFEPAEDYGYLVREAFGRRVSMQVPAQSLLLLKAVGTIPHGGGKRLDASSPYYATLLRWIEQGAPGAGKDDPVVQRIEVQPRETMLPRGGKQQLTVTAHLSDGSKRDVTALARFDSNQTDLADVSASGLVEAGQLPGSAAIMVRYQDHVDVFRALIPLGVPVTRLPPVRNFIDEHVFAQLRKLGLPPSDLADDATFLRRVTIDIAGRLPTKAEADAFLADRSADRIEKLVDRLLASKDYADYFANKWSAILRNRRNTPNDDPAATVAFHDWIRDSLHENRPYDQFVREVLTATGPEVKSPPAVWFRELKDAPAVMEDAAQLFLGQRIQCAKCHHHPLEKWSQADYWGLTAFFAQTTVKMPTPAKGGKNKAPALPAEVVQKMGLPQVSHPRTNEKIRPTVLGGKPAAIAPDADPRLELAKWMSQKDNPFFARALVNRYWKHFFGRGLVDPEDDLRLTNPATNPELLDALAKSFVDSKYDLKRLVRTICTSSVYRLGSEPNQHNARDRQHFSRFYPRRLNAEVLLDAIDDVTLGKTAFKGVPAETRAVQLPDNQFESYFLSVFGRPDAASPCECERSSDASLAQALYLFNSEELLYKISGKVPTTADEPAPMPAKGGKNKQPPAPPKPSGKGGVRLAQLVADKRPHQERLRELYLSALSREPAKEEMTALLAHIEKKKDEPQGAYTDILWALLNTKEFQYNH
jgi:hypothetical protein